MTMTSGSTAVCIRGEHDACANNRHCRCRCHYPVTCPDPRLHQVADAHLRPLADLLRAAVEVDEIADIVRDHSDLTVAEYGRLANLRAAVRALDGTR